MERRRSWGPVWAGPSVVQPEWDPHTILLVHTPSLSTATWKALRQVLGKRGQKGSALSQEAAQERGDSEKNDDDLDHSYCLYLKVVICNFHKHWFCLGRKL